MFHADRQNALLAAVLVRVTASVHHPRPAGLDPRYARVRECRGGRQSLLLDRWAGDGLRVGLVDCDGVVVVGSADLSVRGFGRLGMGGHIAVWTRGEFLDGKRNRDSALFRYLFVSPLLLLLLLFRLDGFSASTAASAYLMPYSIAEVTHSHGSEAKAGGQGHYSPILSRFQKW